MTNDDCIMTLTLLINLLQYEVNDNNSCIIEALNFAVDYLKNTRPQGKWINLNPEKRGYAEFFRCSNCLSNVQLSYWSKECEYDYCPNCGAQMGVDDNDN